LPRPLTKVDAGVERCHDRDGVMADEDGSDWPLEEDARDMVGGVAGEAEVKGVVEPDMAAMAAACTGEE